jgi:hypothetical protein
LLQAANEEDPTSLQEFLFAEKLAAAVRIELGGLDAKQAQLFIESQQGPFRPLGVF